MLNLIKSIFKKTDDGEFVSYVDKYKMAGYKDIDETIEWTKNHLLKEINLRGVVHEDFGNKEAEKIYDRFIDKDDYSMEMNVRRAKLLRFKMWCMEHGLKNI